MPLDKRIAEFLASLAGTPAPVSLTDMRMATETGLRQLQGKGEMSGGIKDYIVVADDGHRIMLRAYKPVAANDGSARPAMLFAHGGGTINLARHWLTRRAG